MLSREARRRLEQWLNTLSGDKKLYINNIINERLEKASASVMDKIYVCISAALVEYEDDILNFTIEDINHFIAMVGDYLVDAGERMEEDQKMGNNKDINFDEKEFEKICLELFDAGYNQKRAIDILRKKFPEAPKAVIPVYYKKYKEEWVKPKIPVKVHINENSKPKILEVDPQEFADVELKEDRVSKNIAKELGIEEGPEEAPAALDVIEFVYPLKAKYKGEEVTIQKDHFVCSEGSFDNLEGLLNYKEAAIKEFEDRVAAIAAVVKRFE